MVWTLSSCGRVLWPRLVAKIDPTFAATVDDAKTSFDFMLNTSFFCALTAATVFAISLSHPLVLAWHGPHPFLSRSGAFLALALVFYSFAVNRAAAWGDQVRSAFDLYRLDLLAKLGYSQKPLTYQEERAIWLKISSQLLYANSRNTPLPYEQETMRVVLSPPEIDADVWREISAQQPNQRILVSIYVTNNDFERKIDLLRIIDTIPDGFKYVLDSLVVCPRLAEDPFVTRFAPLDFQLGPVPPQIHGEETVTHSICYEISAVAS